MITNAVLAWRTVEWRAFQGAIQVSGARHGENTLTLYLAQRLSGSGTSRSHLAQQEWRRKESADVSLNVKFLNYKGMIHFSVV